MTQESISVLMPVRNGASFIDKAMSMIVGSISVGDEIIIIEDGSQDNSFELLQRWSRDFPTINLVKTGGVGLIASLNLGISIASNPWIARYDVDDRYSLRRLELQRSQLGTQNLVAIFSDYQVWFRDQFSIGIIPSPIFDSAIKVSLVKNSRTPHPSVIFNRAAALEVGSYRESDTFVEDMSLWLRLSRVGKFTSIPDKLLSYQIWKNSVTSLNSIAMRQARAKLLNELNVMRTDLNYVQDNFGSIIKAYENYPLSQERILWLAYETLLAMSREPNHQANRTQFGRYISSRLLTPNYIAALSSEFLKIIARRLFRQI